MLNISPPAVSGRLTFPTGLTVRHEEYTNINVCICLGFKEGRGRDCGVLLLSFCFPESARHQAARCAWLRFVKQISYIFSSAGKIYNKIGNCTHRVNRPRKILDRREFLSQLAVIKDIVSVNFPFLQIVGV